MDDTSYITQTAYLFVSDFFKSPMTGNCNQQSSPMKHQTAAMHHQKSGQWHEKIHRQWHCKMQQQTRMLDHNSRTNCIMLLS
jgi:hypothetical protein